MKSKIIYTSLLSLLALVLYFTGIYLFSKFPSFCPFKGFGLLVMIFFNIMFFINNYLIWRKGASAKTFVKDFMLMLVIKFFLLIILLMVGIVALKSEARCFLITFLGLYFPFTVFQLAALFYQKKKP